MSKGFMKSALMPLLFMSCAILLLSGCKKKEETAVVEEVPAVVAPKETDTTATLAEEPTLKQVGKGAKGAKNKKGKEARSHQAPVSSASADKAGFSESGHFVVQVNVFKNKSQAAKLVEKLAAAGYPAYVAEVETPVPSMPGTYHRVRVGNFARVADAKAFGENTLTPMGYSFWVDNKKNDAVGGDGSSAGAESSYSPAPEATPAAYESAPEPKAHKGKRKKSKKQSDESGMSSTPSDMSMPASPSTPSEPAVPNNDSWSSPKSESAAPQSEPTPTPRMEEKSPESTPSSSSTPSPTSTPKSPSDTGKVNLDEW